MEAREFGAVELRVARIAHEALRSLLSRGEAPTPAAFARAYADEEARVGEGPVPSEAPRPLEARRLCALLSSSLAALAAFLPPDRPEVARCLDLAGRLIASSQPARVAADVEKLLASLPHEGGGSGPPWRELSIEALRHVVSLLPEGAAADEVQRARASLSRAQGPALVEAAARTLRLLRRSVLAG